MVEEKRRLSPQDLRVVEVIQKLDRETSRHPRFIARELGIRSSPEEAYYQVTRSLTRLRGILPANIAVDLKTGGVYWFGESMSIEEIQEREERQLRETPEATKPSTQHVASIGPEAVSPILPSNLKPHVGNRQSQEVEDNPQPAQNTNKFPKEPEAVSTLEEIPTSPPPKITQLIIEKNPDDLLFEWMEHHARSVYANKDLPDLLDNLDMNIPKANWNILITRAARKVGLQQGPGGWIPRNQLASFIKALRQELE